MQSVLEYGKEAQRSIRSLLAALKARGRKLKDSRVGQVYTG